MVFIFQQTQHARKAAPPSHILRQLGEIKKMPPNLEVLGTNLQGLVKKRLELGEYISKVVSYFAENRVAKDEQGIILYKALSEGYYEKGLSVAEMSEKLSNDGYDKGYDGLKEEVYKIADKIAQETKGKKGKSENVTKTVVLPPEVLASAAEQRKKETDGIVKSSDREKDKYGGESKT